MTNFPISSSAFWTCNLFHLLIIPIPLNKSGVRSHFLGMVLELTNYFVACDLTWSEIPIEIGKIHTYVKVSFVGPVLFSKSVLSMHTNITNVKSIMICNMLIMNLQKTTSKSSSSTVRMDIANTAMISQVTQHSRYHILFTIYNFYIISIFTRAAAKGTILNSLMQMIYFIFL